MMFSARAPSTLQAILYSGLAGAFCIALYLVVTLSWVFHTATASRLFLWDASNVLGRDAFQGGLGTALFGCFLHLMVSMVWGAVFVLVLARTPAVVRHPIVSGILAGIGVMFVMRYAIVPLGGAPTSPYTWLSFANNLVAHTFFFGVPTLVVARYFTQKESPPGNKS